MKLLTLFAAVAMAVPSLAAAQELVPNQPVTSTPITPPAPVAGTGGLFGLGGGTTTAGLSTGALATVGVVASTVLFTIISNNGDGGNDDTGAVDTAK